MHINRPSNQRSAPRADRSEVNTSHNRNFAGMDPYAAASLETPHPHPSRTQAASPEIQNVPLRVTASGSSTQRLAEQNSAYFVQSDSSDAPSATTKAFNNPRTPESLKKAKADLSADSPAFVTLIDNACTRATLAADTAVRFVLAMEHEGHPPPDKGGRDGKRVPNSMGGFARCDETSKGTVSQFVKWKNGQWKLQSAINNSVNHNRKHYESLFGS
jgi:hypothetical protein